MHVFVFFLWIYCSTLLLCVTSCDLFFIYANFYFVEVLILFQLICITLMIFELIINFFIGFVMVFTVYELFLFVNKLCNIFVIVHQFRSIVLTACSKWFCILWMLAFLCCLLSFTLKTELNEILIIFEYVDFPFVKASHEGATMVGIFWKRLRSWSRL